MKKPTIALFIAMVFWYVVLYLVCSLMSWNLNPYEWSIVVKGNMGIGIILISLLTIFYHKKDKKENDSYFMKGK